MSQNATSIFLSFLYLMIFIPQYLQVDKWGLVEGGHDVDIADLKVQMSSAVVFLHLSRRQ
jgi:ATP synthase F1 complex assembly factor 2